MKAEYSPPFNKDRIPLQSLLPLMVPLTLFIDPSNKCNMSCSFCFNGDKEKLKSMSKRTIMNLELFKKIINDIEKFPEKIKKVHLHGFGEPLLNKNFNEMVKIIKDAKVAEYVATTTNASTLTENNVHKLVEAGLDQIHISIYGLTDKQYMNFTRTKVNFQKLVNSIKLLYKLKQNCSIHIKITGNYFDEEEKEKFLKIFGNYCDTIFIDNAVDVWPDIIVDKGKNSNDNHLYGMMSTKNKVCSSVLYQMMVHSDGLVSPCCVDYEQRLIIGDVKKDSLTNIWNNRIVNKIRLNHLKKNIKNYKVCQSCTYNDCVSTVDIDDQVEMLITKYKEKFLL